jgi:hypothetical protein
MDDFISEEDLLTFEGYLRYQAVDPAMLTHDGLKEWQEIFSEARERCEATPKVGLMKLQRLPGEQKYAVAIRRDGDLWLTMWVRCSRKGEIFIMYPRGDRDGCSCKLSPGWNIPSKELRTCRRRSREASAPNGHVQRNRIFRHLRRARHK